MKKKIAIIGAGYMASEYLKVLKDLKNIDLVGIIGKSKNNLNKIQKIKKIPIFKDVQTLFKFEKPDGIICVVNEMNTFEILKSLNNYDCKILCEKPIGINFDQAKKITRLKIKNKIYLALNRRYFSSTLKLKKFLKHDVSNRFIDIIDQEAPKISTSEKKRIRYWMYCNSIHLIDYIYLLGRGSIKKIVNSGSIKKGIICSKFFFSNGDIILYRALWDRPGPWSVNISTKKNFYTLKPLEQLNCLNSNRKKSFFKCNYYDVKYKPGLFLLVDDFIKALKNKKHDLNTISYNLKLMKLINKIYNV